jgi:hypothetical protein
MQKKYSGTLVIDKVLEISCEGCHEDLRLFMVDFYGEDEAVLKMSCDSCERRTETRLRYEIVSKKVVED